MKQTTTDLDRFTEQLGRELYNSTDAYIQLFPQLQDLEKHGKEYRSSYKLNGEHRPQHRDKTVITEQYPLIIIEHGEPARNIIAYIAEQRNITWMDAVREVANLVGMELPSGDNDQAAYKARARRQELMAVVQEYYSWNYKNAAPVEIKKYLQSRFKDTEIEQMGLGYIPSQQQLEAYLKNTAQRDPAEVDAFMAELNPYIGSIHRITIPIYRAGNIRSFIYRHNNQDRVTAAKYQYHKNTTGEPINTRFDYIPAIIDNGELTIVEGQLDCLQMLAAGFKNVVATGTNHINPDAVRDAIQRGAKRFTILYDADPTDKDPDKNSKSYRSAANTIQEAAEQIGEAESIHVYIAQLPQQDKTKKVDPGSYITDNGADALQAIIDNKARSWYWELVQLAEPYSSRELTDAEIDTLNDGLASIYETITQPAEQLQFKQRVSGLWGNCGEKEIEQMLENHTAKLREKRAQKAAATLLQEAQQAMAAGNVNKAIEMQEKAAAVVTEARAEAEYKQMLQPTTKRSIIDGLKQMPDALRTGLYLGEEKEENEIQMPAGALSIIAAPTSHGKTTMLVDLAVNAAKQNRGKKYLLLSYEEALEAITIKALSSYAGKEYSRSNKKTIQSYLTTGKWYGNDELLGNYQKQEKEFFDMVEDGQLLIKYTDMFCETLCNSIRRLSKESTLGAVFVDYIQYLELGEKRKYDRPEEISKICRMLKDTAVETGLPIILGAQFNRNVTDPTKLALANIGEGGDIERKAAYCLGFWNNDMPYMSGKTEPNMADISKISKSNLYDYEGKKKNHSITAMVLKNRSGIGAQAGANGLLSFNGNTGTVSTYEGKQQKQQKQFSV